MLASADPATQNVSSSSSGLTPGSSASLLAQVQVCWVIPDYIKPMFISFDFLIRIFCLLVGVLFVFRDDLIRSVAIFTNFSVARL